MEIEKIQIEKKTEEKVWRRRGKKHIWITAAALLVAGAVFRSVAASDQYNPCQWKPAIYGRADRGVYFRFAAEPESGVLLSAVPLPAAQVNSVRAGLQAGVPQPVGCGGDRLREECGWLRFLHEQPDVF